MFARYLALEQELDPMSHLSCLPSSAGFGDKEDAPPTIDGTGARLRLLVVIEQRALVRGLLHAWISGLGRGIEVISGADAETVLPPDALSRAIMVVLGAGVGGLSDAWLARQVAWLRSKRADLPVAAIMDADAAHSAVGALDRPSLQGCIATSSSMDVAAAALHLVAAGGRYFPPPCAEDRPAEQAAVGPMRPAAPSALLAKLTPRERAVLELLEQGMANKIIAYRLGMSQSTVKAHVHSIISKLNVRNRTEAAVTSYRPAMMTQTEMQAR